MPNAIKALRRIETERELTEAEERRLVGMLRVREDNEILEAFECYYYSDGSDYEDCEIEREGGRVFVLWYDPEHMRGCLGPRTFQAIKVDNSYAFEEV